MLQLLERPLKELALVTSPSAAGGDSQDLVVDVPRLRAFEVLTVRLTVA